MISPSDANIRNLSGNWVMDNSSSTNLDSVLKTQGIGWVTRKTISVSTTTLKITQSSDIDGSTLLTLEPALTGGLKGVPERRPLNWTEFEQNDTLFGLVRIRSHYIDGTMTSDGRVRPLVGLQIKDAGPDSESFLGEAISMEQQDEATGGTIEKAFIHDFVYSVNSGWIAEQIWAVERIGEENVLTRRVVVVNGRSIQSARVIYRRQ